MFGRILVALLMSMPVALVATPAQAATDWQVVDAGSTHTCGVRASGQLFCWGSDSQGKLGNGAITGSQTSPVRITTASDWKTVSAGGAHTCAIRSTGILYCWGYDQFGQVGNGATTGNQTSPVQITTATDWKSVTAGNVHTCATRSTGKLYCWGSDSSGQLGNGAAGSQISPQQITAASDWKTVSASGANTCGIRSTGKLYCWGSDLYGQVGNGATVGDQVSPVQITTAADWKSVAAGGGHTCAIRSTGKLYCWGYDESGQVGNGATTGNQVSPVQITAAADWKSVAAGAVHTCATRSTGKLYCWGLDSSGQVGNGATTGNQVSPVQITTASDWKSFTGGDEHTCAIRSAGLLYCWGSDEYGQVGNGAVTGNPTSPQLI